MCGGASTATRNQIEGVCLCVRQSSRPLRSVLHCDAIARRGGARHARARGLRIVIQLVAIRLVVERSAAHDARWQR